MLYKCFYTGKDSQSSLQHKKNSTVMFICEHAHAKLEFTYNITVHAGLKEYSTKRSTEYSTKKEEHVSLVKIQY